MDSSSKAQFNLRLRDIGTMRQTRQGDYFTAREQYIAERDDLSEYEEMKEKFNLPKMNRAKGTMKSSDLWSKKERRQFLQEVLIRNNKIPIPQNYERLTAKEIFYKKRGLLSYQKEPTSPQRRGDMSERKSPSRSPKAAATQYHFNLKRLEQTASKESATKRSIFTPRDVSVRKKEKEATKDLICSSVEHLRKIQSECSVFQVDMRHSLRDLKDKTMSLSNYWKVLTQEKKKNPAEAMVGY